MVLSSRQNHYESSPGSFDESRMVLSDCQPKTKPDDLGCESACTLYRLPESTPTITIWADVALLSFNHFMTETLLNQCPYRHCCLLGPAAKVGG